MAVEWKSKIEKIIEGKEIYHPEYYVLRSGFYKIV